MTPIVWLRIGVRFVSLSAITLIRLNVWLVGIPFTRSSPRARGRWRDRQLRGWSRGLLRVLGGRVTCFGTPPRHPFLLVSNHLSYVDVMVLGSVVQGVFVAKSEVARWPFIGPLTRWGDTIFVDRGSRRSVPRALERIEELIDAGDAVIVFPEGTSSPGVEVLPFTSPLLAVAARKLQPVSYATLTYATDAGEMPAHLSVCWWGDMTLVGHIVHLLSLKRFRATVIFGDEPLIDPDRKELARRLRDAVAESFDPVVSAEELCHEL
ncbi:MAG: lysophospholipid acyltransferase family protein [Thermoanaerobaculia bacterium]|nr:lysophospholipid acyltransferase family protein [Thermoanaerobaculia bacterium]